ncbi:hypothetical protein INT44_004187 [Umbelopsis vinacea]|uniref:3-hydroxyisobutyryl-CoA hydrolase n=1 Tax=Umbelopsis vinacea TaxID=44442 RepID=A0A8H7QBY4_9FUNG|nr:hypothetical protein INT44_004187 [Umbelopsis vinacea]
MQFSSYPKQPNVIHGKVLGLRSFVLNRPYRMNALNLSMIRNIYPQLQAWERSDNCKLIIMKGAGKNEFCAGDDVRDILLQVKQRDPNALHFYREEFDLIHYISTLKTPYISFMNGHALGAALGISVHAPFRIATEKTIFAVPEAGIGLFPDAGASFFLPRLDGQIGTFLALTGTRLEGIQAFNGLVKSYAGVATHYVPSERLEQLEDRLSDMESSDHEVINMVIEEYSTLTDTKQIGFEQETRQIIDRCFRHDTVEAILEALDRERPMSFTREAKAKMLHYSPTSLRVILKILRAGANKTLGECLQMEYDLVQKFMATPDFYEGVDAQLVRKPREKPKWQPPALADIPSEMIDKLYFTKPSPNSLQLRESLDFKEYPYQRYSLPSELEVRAAVLGESPEFRNSGGIASTEETVRWFKMERKKKKGVAEKVRDILSRKTIIIDGKLCWQASL